MTSISYIKAMELNADIGQGRSLGLTPTQSDPLEVNFRNLINNYEASVAPVNETTEPNKISFPGNDVSINNGIINNVNDITEVSDNVSNDDVVEPFANDVLSIDSIIEQPKEAPVVMDNPIQNEPVNSSGPEIISANEETEFDKMQKEILEANRLYQQRIEEIINSYKSKLDEVISKTAGLKNQAEEVLKNAQAAEQIANIAYQNSQNQDSNQVIV